VIEESYASGSVEGSSNLGGLVGSGGGAVADSYWDRDTTGQNESVAGGTNLKTAEMTGLNATENMAGFEFPTNERTWHVTDNYPALAWQDTEPFYEVNVTDTTAPVTESETLEVTATVTNWAAGGDRTVELRDFDGDEQDTEAVTLEGGDSEERTLKWETAVSDAGSGSVTVTSGDDSDSEVVTVEAAPSTGSGTSSPSASVDSDQTTSVRTVGDELRADITPSVSHGVSESQLEFSNTRAIELRFVADDTADEDRPVATTERLAIEFTEAIDTTATIREGSEPTSDDTRDLDEGLEAVGYLQIATDIEPDQFESATIEFSVPTEALAIADGDTDAVSLHHFDPDADEWRSLETTLIGETADGQRFSAGVDSFSQFAIGVGLPDADDDASDIDADSSADETAGDGASGVDENSSAGETDAGGASGVDDDSGADEADSDSVTEDVDDGTPGFSVGLTLLAITVCLVARRRFRDSTTHSSRPN